MNAKSLLTLGVLLWTLAPTQADEPSKLTPEKLLPNWDKNQAAKYLDSRQEAWFAWSWTDRGAGSSKTSCMSCHTLFAYALARPAGEITVADVVRVVDGPLAAVRGLPPEDTAYPEPAQRLRDLWVALRAGMRQVLEETTIADLATGALPSSVAALLADDGAWARR